jgi:uncharacterized protein
MITRKAGSTIDREGVVARVRIEAGTRVHTMTGEAVWLPGVYWRLVRGRLRSIDDVFTLGYVRFLVLDALGLAFNHSCDPNCGFRTLRELYALRTIEPGEEATFDYSLTVPGVSWWKMSCPCRCGAAHCRGVIGNIATLPQEVYDRYLALGAIPRELQISRRFTIAGQRFGI